jgi:phosphopantothenoylcysteine decarboxylase/phosphopantothenate--cysteine ligase
MSSPRILLVVGGGIAAYKSCELVRLIRKNGGEVSCVLTDGGSHFVTEMALAALSENPVYTSLWDLKDEVEMGHIQLSRAADLIVVCPATADLMAKMSAGIADDLATTLLLATDKPVMAVPAMNVRMWQHEATIRNVATLRAAGVFVMEPDEGPMACGEFGPGRLPEPPVIWRQIAALMGIDAGEEPEPVYVQPQLHPGDFDAGPAESEVVEATGLGGLSGSMISRTTKRQAITFDEPLPGDFGEGDFLPEEAPPFVEELPPPLVLGGSILSKKGKARSAPPTDPEAINHTVSHYEGATPPEPFHNDRDEVLDGQPDFDEDPSHRPLFGKHVLITAGPTHEPIDPVRYIANRSSGKQGYAIAAAAAAAGARVTLISGPVALPTPPGVDRIDVETAQEMADAVKRGLPADIAVMVAAVADWRTRDISGEKIKKRGSAPPALLLTENPDILASVSAGKQRPRLLIGFAAETEDVLPNATEKRKRKGVDWIVANDVSGDVMGGAVNSVHIVTAEGVESLPEMPKEDVARALVDRMAAALNKD